jgi:hypothetical protein
MHEPVPNQPSFIENEETAEKTASNLLSQLLESALSQRKRTLTEAEWALLRDVVKQPEGSQATFEEFATGLVEALLKARLANNFKNPEALSLMSATIARTLCSDPTARQRMLELQRHLNRQA